MQNYTIKALLLLAIIKIVQGLIGYDCGSRQLSVTTISLRDVGDCNIPRRPINTTKTFIQLLQINEYDEIPVIQCKVEIHRTIYYCGMNSHISVVKHGENEYIYEVSRSACMDMHESGSFNINGNHIIHGIRVNNTVTHSATFAGSLTNEGSCSGTVYSDPFGTWDKVVVQGTIKITLYQQTAKLNADAGIIHLNSGTKCKFDRLSCIDIIGGHSFWNALPRDLCEFRKYSVLYEGNANKVIDMEDNTPQILYTVTTDDITFALTAQGTKEVCGYTIVRTEHPKLLIFETFKGKTFADHDFLFMSNLDIFAYVNSKFVYVEKHIRAQMKTLYRDVLVQRCNLERQTIKNSLSIATQAPDEFAYDLMKGPGYMAVAAGEVVHIIKCIPVEVKLQRDDENCFVELSVERNNKTFFMTPRTHILKSKGTQIQCNEILPQYYFVGDVWYRMMPKPVTALTPEILKPLSEPTWKYTNPADLATSGIYTEKDLDQLRERIMFPVEQSSFLNDLTREMRGHPLADNQGMILKMLNEEAVEKILISSWDRLWSKFLTFGTVSAGIIAILMIIHTIKLLVDIAIRGYALHSIYGWSIHLLGAIWSSVAHLLLYLGQAQNVSTAPTPLTPRTDNMDIPIVTVQSTADDRKEVVYAAPVPKDREVSTSKGFFSMNN